MMAMNRHGMKKIAIKQEGIEIELEREVASASVVSMVPSFTAPMGMSPSLSLSSGVKESDSNRAFEERRKSEGAYITSPMVGTFYAGASPKDPPYIKIGDKVEEETVVCIVEAMKVMNEVKAGITGKVVEILIKNGDPVEFGTKIFRVE